MCEDSLWGIYNNKRSTTTKSPGLFTFYEDENDYEYEIFIQYLIKLNLSITITLGGDRRK